MPHSNGFSSNRRVARRNPQAAFRNMAKAGSRLESARDNFFSRGRTIQGKELLGIAMKSVVAKQRVRELLILDPKFNLENDAAFNERLFDFLRRSKKRNNFSFAIMDLDFLKQLNNFSYAAADRAIAVYSDLINTTAKKYGGFAGRFGGDELKILIPADKRTLARELDAARKKLNRIKSNGVQLSFSAGVCGMPLGKTAGGERAIVEAINHRANEALKKSKSTGRNRVTIV